MGRNGSCQKIGRRAKGLVDMPEDKLRAVSSGIGLEGSDIAHRILDIAGGQHANKSNNTPKERMMHQRFGRSTE